MEPDARHIARIAARTAAELARASRGASPATWRRRVRRAGVLAWQVVARKAKMLLREHWDIALFDVLFGSLKAFAIYPALYFAGLAWTIPVMEYLPLNTQLWTAGYLAVRGQLFSEIARWRYGHSSRRLDALRDRLLGVQPRDARHVHRFALGGARRVLRIRRSRFRSWLARCRGGRPEPGVALQSDLRRLVRDPEFLFRANPLRANPYLYEEVLLAQLLATPHAHARLAALSAPDEPLTGEGRALRAALGEAQDLAVARMTEQADALAAALRRHRGATALCLRWVHASLRRDVRRRLRELADLEYRLLAEIVDGGSAAASAQRAPLRVARAELRAAIRRAEQLVRRARSATSPAAIRRLARDALADARARGLALRRARLAAWLDGAAPVAPRIALPVRGVAE